VAGIATARGVPQAQVALSWMTHKPFITAPIIGASKPQHLIDAIGALSLKLETEEINRLESPYVPHAITGHA
jgi:1-deoxyxylulose-5-phosphate synthase